MLKRKRNDATNRVRSNLFLVDQSRGDLANDFVKSDKHVLDYINSVKACAIPLQIAIEATWTTRA